MLLSTFFGAFCFSALEAGPAAAVLSLVSAGRFPVSPLGVPSPTPARGSALSPPLFLSLIPSLAEACWVSRPAGAL